MIVTNRRSYGREEILLKFAVIVERQDILLIHAIESMTSHLSSSLKIKMKILIIMSKIIKDQSQKYSLSKLILLMSNIKQTLLAIL